MSSHIEPDVLAVLVAAALWFLLGYLWYGVLFKRAWARGMGMPVDMKPAPADMAKSMGLGLVGILLTVAVFAWLTEALADAATGVTLAGAVEGAAWVWLGFFLPRGLGAVAWEARPWSVAAINAAHDLVGLLVVAVAYASLA